ncbi:MAG: hypothetical protein ACLTKG_03960 [Collinsella intestinalis]
MSTMKIATEDSQPEVGEEDPDVSRDRLLPRSATTLSAHCPGIMGGTFDSLRPRSASRHARLDLTGAVHARRRPRSSRTST